MLAIACEGVAGGAIADEGRPRRTRTNQRRLFAFAH
jgi:hypothetical protein